MISNNGLLYIEPTQPASSGPVLDHLTRKVTAAFRKAGRPPGNWEWYGPHECVCGATSTSRDYRLPNGELTNSLCVHYVAHHRSEVPPDQLARITAFPFGEAEPNDNELQGPDLVLARVRASVEEQLGKDWLSTWIRWGLRLDVEGLSRSLRGGCLPALRGLSDTRSDAQALLGLLWDIQQFFEIQPDLLSCVKTAVEQDHGDVREWGEQALRIPGWNRELWVSPLVVLIQRSKGLMERDLAAAHLGSLGPAAVPTLIELAKREADDDDFQDALKFALAVLDRRLGVSLQAQIPPRPGQVGTCWYCNASGDCYCKRKGMANSRQCTWCNGSGKCHICHGSGRPGQ
jgi:hypothetical protein